jgi:hypothetical protein
MKTATKTRPAFSDEAIEKMAGKPGPDLFYPPEGYDTGPLDPSEHGIHIEFDGTADSVVPFSLNGLLWLLWTPYLECANGISVVKTPRMGPERLFTEANPGGLLYFLGENDFDGPLEGHLISLSEGPGKMPPGLYPYTLETVWRIVSELTPSQIDSIRLVKARGWCADTPASNAEERTDQ